LKDEHAATVLHLGELNSRIRKELRAHEDRQGLLENKLDSTATTVEGLVAAERRAMEEVRALDPLYAAFEDRFRGARALIRARVEPYLELVREAGAGTAEAP